MQEQSLQKEERELRRELIEKSKSGELKVVSDEPIPPTKKRRWDIETPKQEPSETPTPRSAPKTRLALDGTAVLARAEVVIGC